MNAIGVQWRRHLEAHEFPHPLAGDGAGQSGQQPPVGQCVVGGLAEVPPDRRGGDPFLHVMVVQQLAFAHSAQVGKAGAVAHDVADGDPRLAVGAELRPVLGHRGVVVDQSAIRQPMDDGRGHTFGRREHHRSGVGGPVPLAPPVGPSGPHIDDGLAVEVYRKRSPAQSRMGEHGGETPHGTGEARVCGSLHPVGQFETSAVCRGGVHTDEFTSPTRRLRKSLSIC